ncbi:MAG: ABC transporter substrate-binding protein [Gemmatimonadota bacterium]
MRYALATIALCSLVAAAPTAGAERSHGAHRVGVVWQTDPAATRPLFDILREALGGLGYREGHNITFEQRWAANEEDRVAAVVAELVAQQVDLIVAPTNSIVAAATRATTTIPVVMVVATDPVGAGLVSNLRRPGGNVTGLSVDTGAEAFTKGLELLRATVPRLSRVALLGSEPTYEKAIADAAQDLKLTTRLLRISTSGDVETAFTSIKRESMDAVIVLPGPITFAAQRLIADTALRFGMPSFSGFASLVHAGGLVSYGPSVPDLIRRSAAYVDRILKGARPGDLPVEQPRQFDLVINLKTAKALGLTVPPSVLLRADQVIE